MDNLKRNAIQERAILELLAVPSKFSNNIFCYEEVSSVLDVAKYLSLTELDSPSLILAKSQTAGRGQQGRPWQAVEVAFLGCLLFPNSKIALRDLPSFSLVIGFQVAQILHKTGVDVGVKWPNDVLNKKHLLKICGVLLESDPSPHAKDELRNLRVGIGINLAGSPERGTSIKEQTGQDVAVERIAAAILESCCCAYEKFEVTGFGYFQKDWNDMDVLRGKQIEFQHANKTLYGRAAGVDDRGHLMIELPTGLESFASGRIIKIICE